MSHAAGNFAAGINDSKAYGRSALEHSGSNYPSSYHANYQANSVNKPAYYPNLTASTSNAQTTSMLQWQQSLQHQQAANQHLQHRIGQGQIGPTHEEITASSVSPTNRFDMFLRNPHPSYFISCINETSPSWCQSNSSSKESFFQPPVAKNICPLCGKNYARPSTLKTHMRIHSGERPFHCKVCNKSFSQAANLTAHLRVHSGEKPFSCSICRKTFSQSSSVTTHMRTHSGDRPYKCPICRKGFSDSSTLTKHLRIHSGEKPYRCSFCSMSFSQSGNLNRHMKVHEHHTTRKHELSPSSKSSSR